MSVESSIDAAARGRALDRPQTRYSHHRSGPSHARLLTLRDHALVAAVPVLCLLFALAATRTNSLAPQSVRPFPPFMAGLFRFIGFRLNTAEVVPLIVAMVASYFVAMRVVDRVSTRTVVVAVVSLNVIAVLAPPILSTDMFSYQVYARMLAIYHVNPYTHGPYAIYFDFDSVYQYIGALWIYTPSVYGPLFTLVSVPLAWVSVAFSMLVFKAIAGLCCAGMLRLVWKAAVLRGLNPTRSLALVGLNPVVMLACVGGGHNDALMTWLMMLGVYSFLTRRDLRSSALMTAGAAIKLTGGVVLPFALLATTAPGESDRRKRLLVGIGAVAIVLAALSAVFFGTGVLKMFSTLQNAQSQGAWQSVPGFMFSVAHSRPSSIVKDLLDLILLGVVGRLMWLVWKQRLDWIEGSAWATVAVLATAWSMLPWYITWLMPLAAICRGRKIWQASLVISGLASAIMLANCIPNLSLLGL